MKIRIPKSKIKKRTIKNNEYYYYAHYYEGITKTFYAKTISELQDKFKSWVEKEESRVITTDTIVNHFKNFIEYHKNTWKNNTYISYSYTLKYIEQSTISKIKLENVDDGVILNLISTLNLSFSSKELILNHLRIFFNYCVRRGFINHNPTAFIKLKNFEVDNDKDKYIPPQVQNEILDMCKNTEFELPIKLMLKCGLRIGESICITKKDFIQPNKLRINKSNNRGIVEKPKNSYSDRVIIIPNELIPLVVGSDGTKVARNTIQVWLRKNFNVQAHSLRHTFITESVMANVNLQVLKEYVGHSPSSTMIQDIYNHIQDEFRQNEMNKIFLK